MGPNHYVISVKEALEKFTFHLLHPAREFNSKTMKRRDRSKALALFFRKPVDLPRTFTRDFSSLDPLILSSSSTTREREKKELKLAELSGSKEVTHSAL